MGQSQSRHPLSQPRSPHHVVKFSIPTSLLPSNHNFEERAGQILQFTWEAMSSDKQTLRQTFHHLPIDEPNGPIVTLDEPIVTLHDPADDGCGRDDGSTQCELSFLETWTVRLSPRYDPQTNTIVPNTRNFEFIMGNPTDNGLTWIDFNELAPHNTLFTYDGSKPRTCSATNLLTGELTDVRVIYDNYFFHLVPGTTPDTIFRNHPVLSIKCENLWFDYEQADLVGVEVSYLLRSVVHTFSWDSYYRQTFIAEPIDDNQRLSSPTPRTAASHPLVRYQSLKF